MQLMIFPFNISFLRRRSFSQFARLFLLAILLRPKVGNTVRPAVTNPVPQIHFRISRHVIQTRISFTKYRCTHLGARPRKIKQTKFSLPKTPENAHTDARTRKLAVASCPTGNTTFSKHNKHESDPLARNFHHPFG